MASFEKLEGNQVKLTMSIPAADFEKAIDSAYLKLRKTIAIPGFRKGHAPKGVIEKTYGWYVFVDDAFDIAYPEVYEAAVKEHDVKPVDRPEITILSAEKGKDVEFEAVVTVMPEVTLGQYKGIEVAKQEYNVTDEMVDAEIEREREKVARMIDVERPVENGDEVELDYSGTVDGVKFDGGTAEHQQLTIGSGMFIPGFEEQMVGMNIGEERDLSVKFPEQYHADNLAGKDAVFHVKVNGIQTKVRPELDDDFAADVSEFDTFEAYKANIVADLEKNAADRAEANLEDALVQKVVDAADCDIPDAMIQDEITTMLREMEMRMIYQGIRFEDYLKYTGQTLDQVRENYKPEAANRVKTQLVLEAVAKAENIVPTDEDVDEAIADQAKRVNRDVEEFKASLSEQQKEYLKETAGIKKVIDFLKANAVITEKAAEEKAE